MSSQLPWLLLDVGNTAMKWRFADSSGLLEAGGSVPDLTALGAVLEGQEWALACIASVAGDAADAELLTELSQRSDAPVHMATTAPSAPGLVNGYREPESMGVDRWLAMLAARSIHTGPLCVIDAGTAVTIDLISGEGDHQGGYIIPGADLQRRALTADTGRIQVDKLETTMMPGITTEACVGAGVWRSTDRGRAERMRRLSGSSRYGDRRAGFNDARPRARGHALSGSRDGGSAAMVAADA